MKILVTGATGVIGRRVVARLVEAGHDVTGAVRGPAKAEQVGALGARSAIVDLFDAEDVRTAVTGHDVVCHLATRIPSLRQDRASQSLDRERPAAPGRVHACWSTPR